MPELDIVREANRVANEYFAVIKLLDNIKTELGPENKTLKDYAIKTGPAWAGPEKTKAAKALPARVKWTIISACYAFMVLIAVGLRA